MEFFPLREQKGAVMITSSSNQQMKNITALMKKAKERKSQNLFVVEGRKMFEEVPPEWLSKVYVSERFLEEPEAEQLLAGKTYEVVADAVFKSISDTQTPQGILCLLRGDRTHLLIVESIQDPGNLGTMLRTGEGAGITGIIMNRTTVDLFNPKTIRSTMGSIYRVPYYIADDLAETIGELKRQKVGIYAAHLKGQMHYDEPSYCKGTAFLIGNEGNGLSDEIAGLADTYVRIPMEGSVESLNAAVSAALLMYETNRQRRRNGK